MRVFEALGLSPDERTDAVPMLFAHLRVTHAAASAGTRPWTAAAEGGTTMRDLVVEHAERFPALRAVMAGGDPTTPSRARGTAAPFDVVELLTLDAGRERIERLTICYDTAPLRASWQAATSTPRPVRTMVAHTGPRRS